MNRIVVAIAAAALAGAAARVASLAHADLVKGGGLEYEMSE